jgi:DNA-binding NtrC family response regulator
MGKETMLPVGDGALAEGARAARLIVCERSGRWAVVLRRELAAANVRLHETRSLAECWEMLAEHRWSFVVVELSHDNADALLERLARRERQFPRIGVAVVADRSLRAYQWLIREAGAIHFVTSPRQLGPLAGVACRHLAHAPETRRSMTERIWASLPWGRSGQSAERREDDDQGSNGHPDEQSSS